MKYIIDCLICCNRHLRDHHCTREGGSYVCRYGLNGVCSSLPLDGVSDHDYDAHICRYHLQEFSSQSKQYCDMEWSIFSAAQNLPAALNDPMRGKQSNMFTKKWGVEFNEKCSIQPSPYLKELNYDDFETYMSEIGKRFTRRNLIQQNVYANATNRLEKRQLKQHLIENDDGIQTIDRRRTLSQTPLKKSNTDIDDLRLIPEIYLKENLNLHHTQTFRQIFGSVVSQNDRKLFNNNISVNRNDSGCCDDKLTDDRRNREHLERQLQEKLSHYLDIVEIRIARQVSQKSSTFFHAMTSQDVIMKEMNSAMNIVRDMRKSLQTLQQTIVMNAIRALRLTCRRNNYKEVLEKLALMTTVHKAQPMLQLLLGTQDYIAALDLISTTQDILSQDLIGIQCFKHLPMQLSEMEKLIDKMLITEFERFIGDTLSWSKNGKSTDLENVENETEAQISIENCKLSCIVMGLLRIKNYTFVDLFKDECILAIRMIIKQLLIEFISKSDLPTEISLTGTGEEAQNITTIGIWIAILNLTTVELLQLLQRIKIITNTIFETINIASGTVININSTSNTAVDLINVEKFLNDRDKNYLEQKLQEVLESVTSYCHERCANFVSEKSLEQMVANADEIIRLSEVINRFDKGTQTICNVKRVPLKVTLRVQINYFANKFHFKRREILEKQLHSELWRAIDCPLAIQELIDELTTNNGFKVIDSTNSKDTIFDHTFLEKKLLQENDRNAMDGHKPKLLYMGKEPYALVQSVIVLIEIIYSYCLCANLIPAVASYLSHNLIDLLKTFNSRCYQLVIGAGAIRCTGMKTITSINLALVARALQLLLLLLPYIRNHFEQCGNGSTITFTGYDAVDKDFTIHLNEISDKIVNIVYDLLVTQLNNWDVRPPIPSQSFRAISWHLTRLYEALTNILPNQDILRIYDDIHRKFKQKLKERLQKLNVVNDGRPQHGVVISELTFYTETLRSLGVTPEDGNKLLATIWT